jgi:TIR domain
MQVARPIDDYFFFSYARGDESQELEDSREYIVEFFKDLCTAIRRKNPVLTENDPIGFFDQELPLGSNYTLSLPDALQECKCLICLYSPTYFGRTICGREVQVFLDRKREHGQEPDVILPVIWKRAERIPVPLAAIQYMHRQFPAIYREKGLRELMIQRGYDLEYREFVTEMADWVIEARQYNLKRQTNPIAFEAVVPAFPSLSPTGTPATTGTTTTEGPKAVRFAYIAKSTPVWSWRPFPPPPPQNSIGQIASLKAISKDFFPGELVLSPNLINELEEYKKNNTLVVLIVDPDSLQVASTGALLKDYDDRNFLNCAVLILWDAGSIAKETTLRHVLETVFDDNYARNYPTFFRDNIRSLQDLEVQLSETLDVLHRNVVSRGSAVRAVPSGPPLPTI